MKKVIIRSNGEIIGSKNCLSDNETLKFLKMVHTNFLKSENLEREERRMLKQYKDNNNMPVINHYSPNWSNDINQFKLSVSIEKI